MLDGWLLSWSRVSKNLSLMKMTTPETSKEADTGERAIEGCAGVC